MLARKQGTFQTYQMYLKCAVSKQLQMNIWGIVEAFQQQNDTSGKWKHICAYEHQ